MPIVITVSPDPTKLNFIDGLPGLQPFRVSGVVRINNSSSKTIKEVIKGNIILRNYTMSRTEFAGEATSTASKDFMLHIDGKFDLMDLQAGKAVQPDGFIDIPLAFSFPGPSEGGPTGLPPVPIIFVLLTLEFASDFPYIHPSVPLKFRFRAAIRDTYPHVTIKKVVFNILQYATAKSTGNGDTPMPVDPTKIIDHTLRPVTLTHFTTDTTYEIPIPMYKDLGTVPSSLNKDDLLKVIA
ncbi:hypothetical protein HK097_006408 [Rhizophlyctis rosea]|uniref:Uncharacterized protein n=1 Tax=Rhizophlyctis rosea TaxID=64517 RepID=A0AAD5SKL5_9FUNG|nr:hypothetical protein HK097_006408 [Rhizophlyctis rosea]